MKRCNGPDCKKLVNEKGRHVRLGEILFCSTPCCSRYFKDREHDIWRPDKVPRDPNQLELPL